MRADVPRRRVPARGERDARRQGRARVGGRASDGLPDADGAELRAGALAAGASTARRGGAGRGASGEVCPHGVSLACSEVHDEDDPRLGEPLCPECFDYEHAVLWNALAPELWRRTAIQLPRELARLRGMSGSGCGCGCPTSRSPSSSAAARCTSTACSASTAERDGEARGAGRRSSGRELLIDAATRGGSARVGALAAPEDRDGRLPGSRRPGAEIRWGAQIEVRELDADGVGGGVVRRLHREVRDEVDRGRRRADVPPRRERPRAAAGPPARPALRRVRVAARRRGAQLHELRLRRWAHQLGFRGHCFTKSRRYSTTFTALRQARHEHQLRRARRAGDRAADRALAVQRLGLPDAGRRLAGRVGAQARADRSGGSRAKSFAPANRSATTDDEGRR